MLAAQVCPTPPSAAAASHAACGRMAGPAQEAPDTAHARAQHTPDASNCTRTMHTGSTFGSRRSMVFHHTQHPQPTIVSG